MYKKYIKVVEVREEQVREGRECMRSVLSRGVIES